MPTPGGVSGDGVTIAHRPRLMLVTDRALVAPGALLDTVVAAVEGGVDCVQVREKDLPDDALLDLVDAIKRGLADAGMAVPIVLNGRPSVALATGVGLHLPEYDSFPDVVPERWPLWGRSVHGPQTAAAAAGDRPGYLVAGSLFLTGSHPGAPALGIDGLRRIVAAAEGVAVIAIGGISADRVPSAVAAGAVGVAVRSGLLAARSPRQAAQAFRAAVDDALDRHR